MFTQRSSLLFAESTDAQNHFDKEESFAYIEWATRNTRRRITEFSHERSPRLSINPKYLPLKYLPQRLSALLILILSW
jgi:hypothetical protein